MLVEVPDHIAARLRAMAERDGQSVETLLAELVEDSPRFVENAAQHAPGVWLVTLAETAQRMNMRAGQDDIAEHFDDHLNVMMADDLLARHTGDDQHDLAG